MTLPTEGRCESCGDPAYTITGYRCECCAGLLERIQHERREAEAATRRRHEHQRKAEELSGWARLEQIALAAAEHSMSDVHEYRVRQTREKLNTREFAYLARLEAAAEAA